MHLCALVFFPVARGGILATRVCAIHHCTCICIERKREREREREKEIERVVEVHLYIYIYIHTHTHTHERGLTCVHHVVVLQEKNDLLIEYAKKGLAGGLLMALQAGADANHKDKV